MFIKSVNTSEKCRRKEYRWRYRVREMFTIYDFRTHLWEYERETQWTHHTWMHTSPLFHSICNRWLPSFIYIFFSGYKATGKKGQILVTVKICSAYIYWLTIWGNSFSLTCCPPTMSGVSTIWQFEFESDFDEADNIGLFSST